MEKENKTNWKQNETKLSRSERREERNRSEIEDEVRRQIYDFKRRDFAEFRSSLLREPVGISTLSDNIDECCMVIQWKNLFLKNFWLLLINTFQ